MRVEVTVEKRSGYLVRDNLTRLVYSSPFHGDVFAMSVVRKMLFRAFSRSVSTAARSDN